jgi:predicted acyl esterase
VIEHVGWVPLPDGRRLHARTWRPDGDERVGVVLSYDPYPNQWLTRAVDAPHGRALAEVGVAYVRVAIAGSGDSDGVLRDEYLASELQDGVDVIAWLAERPWCNGRVGLRGLSWGGFNALQIAALRPEALAAVVSACSTDDRYLDDVHYMGGNVLGYDMQLWATWAHLFFVAPPDPEVVGEAWKQRWLERLESVEPVVATWLSHQRRDAYWLHGSVGADPGAVSAPVLMVGGWEDGYRDAILRFIAARPERTWAVVGPWGHGWPHRVLPGPHIDWVAREVRWWRHWLSGDDNGVEDDPALEAFVQDPRRPNEHLLHRGGRWVSLSAAAIEAEHLVMKSAELADLHVRRLPVQGMHAPVWCPDGDAADFALDQRFEDAAAATIDWEVDEEIAVLGRVRARLRVSADGPDAQVAVRLCDVAPDGVSTLVAMGARNLDGHDGRDVEVSLRATGYVVPRGHTLRLAISPGYWPMLWPSPRATALAVDASRCSIDIPVVPGSATTLSVVPPKPDRARDERAPRRWAQQLFGSDAVMMERVTDSGVVSLDDDSTWRVSDHTTWSTADDPLRSTTTTTAAMERSRGPWRVRWQATSTMTADAECFHVAVRVTASEADKAVFERSYGSDIARDHC